MAENRLTIDTGRIFDTPADRQVEFRGEVDGETRAFAVQYSAIEALTGRIPDAPATAFNGVVDDIARAALRALGRADGDGIVVVGERDLDQGDPDAVVQPGGAVAEAEAHPS